MHPTNFESLTPSERTILRELLRERDQKAVARVLGLSPETVKTHLRNAREKCAADTSFALAKAFARHEGAPPRWGIPLDGGEAEADIPLIDGSQAAQGEFEAEHEEFREDRTSFVFDHETLPLLSAQSRLQADHDVSLRRLLKIGVLVCILMLVIILAFPLSESFQRLANVIDPPTG